MMSLCEQRRSSWRMEYFILLAHEVDLYVFSYVEKAQLLFLSFSLLGLIGPQYGTAGAGGGATVPCSAPSPQSLGSMPLPLGVKAQAPGLTSGAPHHMNSDMQLLPQQQVGGGILPSYAAPSAQAQSLLGNGSLFMMGGSGAAGGDMAYVGMNSQVQPGAGAIVTAPTQPQQPSSQQPVRGPPQAQQGQLYFPQAQPVTDSAPSQQQREAMSAVAQQLIPQAAAAQTMRPPTALSPQQSVVGSVVTPGSVLPGTDKRQLPAVLGHIRS